MDDLQNLEIPISDHPKFGFKRFVTFQFDITPSLPVKTIRLGFWRRHYEEFETVEQTGSTSDQTAITKNLVSLNNYGLKDDYIYLKITNNTKVRPDGKIINENGEKYSLSERTMGEYDFYMYVFNNQQIHLPTLIKEGVKQMDALKRFDDYINFSGKQNIVK